MEEGFSDVVPSEVRLAEKMLEEGNCESAWDLIQPLVKNDDRMAFVWLAMHSPALGRPFDLASFWPPGLHGDALNRYRYHWSVVFRAYTEFPDELFLGYAAEAVISRHILPLARAGGMLEGFSIPENCSAIPSDLSRCISFLLSNNIVMSSDRLAQEILSGVDLQIGMAECSTR